MTTVLSEGHRNSQDAGRILVRLLGGFEVVSSERSLEYTSTASRLIAYLAIRRRPIPRATLAGVLWPESTQTRAQACLRSTLWRIGATHPETISSHGESLVLVDGAVVDLDSLNDAALSIGTDLPPAEAAEVPIPWFSCELLPDWYDEWVVFERERFRLMALHILEWRSAWYLSAGDYRRAGESSLAAIHLAPLRESSHRALVKAHIANGNMSEAVRQYRRYYAMVSNELGVEPSQEMRALFDGIDPAAIAHVA